MKNYEDIAANVFRRRDAYEAKRSEKHTFYRCITHALTAVGVAACIILCLGTGYVFANTFHKIDTFLGYFERRSGTALSQQQQQYLQEVYAEIGQSVTSADVTVTLQAAITDGTTYYIYLDIVAPENMDLDTLKGVGFNRTLQSKNPNRYRISSVSAGCIPIPDGDDKSNTLSMILQTTVTKPTDSPFSFADGYERTLCLETLFAYADEYPYAQYPLANGTWRFSFTFANAAENQPPSIEVLSAPILCQGKQLSGQNITVSVESIQLHALGATLRYRSQSGTGAEAIDFDNIQIVMKDGSMIHAHPRSAISDSSAGYMTYVYDAPVLFNHIAYLTINDQIIPMS